MLYVVQNTETTIQLKKLRIQLITKFQTKLHNVLKSLNHLQGHDSTY
jgi:hypothetical protein